MEALVNVGTVTKTHGLNGAVKVLPNGSDIESYLQLKKVFVGRSESQSDLMKIVSSRTMQNFVLFEFDSVSTLETAKNLIRKNVFVTKKDYESFELAIPEVDWLGFEIFDLTKNLPVGEVMGYEESKAHPIVTVKTKTDTEVMIPFIEDWIVHIRKRTRIIEMNLPDGLW